MSSFALEVFRRLLEQVELVEAAAVRAEQEGFDSAPVLRRSGYVLAVAGIDTYFHEQAARLLTAEAAVGAISAGRVANYLQSVKASDVAGRFGASFVRLRLSYKTLVGPRAVDAMLLACGRDPEAVWRDVAFRSRTRPDRLKLQLQLFYDRRNEIAHEGDWDSVQLDFRVMEQVHLADCVRFITSVAEDMDVVL